MDVSMHYKNEAWCFGVNHDDSAGAAWWTTLTDCKGSDLTLFFPGEQARAEFWAGVAASCVTPKEDDD